MTKSPTNPDFSKSRARLFLEYVLLALCLCVIALRTTLTEGPIMQSSTLSANLGNDVYSLSVSAVLFLSFVFWFIWSSCSKRFLYRFTGIEIGLCIFCVAAIVAGFAAANKRLAITHFAVVLAPPLMAVLLVQILDSQAKIKLVLAVIAALGVVSAYQCTEQFLFSNQMTIEQYEQAPETMLEPLGIEPDTFQQFLFEHRLYSKGVSGFFTTRNSAGSFALMASFAAVALFIEKFKYRKYHAFRPLWLVTSGIAVVVVLSGLVITRSKGAIIGLLFAVAIYVALLRFGNWLKTHRKAIFLACLLLAITGAWAVVSYGLAHGRLPGGNSMLVRWQYWHASAKMYADHYLTGVGPGNFPHFYPRYKPAEALETVADPHNFPLSILTQYGPLGLVGFLALVFLPLWRAASTRTGLHPPKAHQPDPAFATLVTIFLIIISVLLLFTRLIFMPVTTDDLAVMIYVISRYYIPPVALFVIGFWLLTAPLNTTRVTSHEPRVTYFAAALFAAVLGVLLHNLIDFAIFEPGVLTTLWVIIACLIAIDFHQKQRPQFVSKPAPFVKAIVLAAALVIIGSYFSFVWWPVAAVTKTIQTAMSRNQYPHELLAHAAELDSLDPTAPNLNGKLYLQHYYQTGQTQSALLEKAEESFLAAIARNKADFKNYEKLSTVYNLLAEASPQQQSRDYLNKGFDSAILAVECYPGSARLHFKLANIAEQLGKTDIAIEHYKKAIDIEEAFRRQFQIMYPEWKKIVSRLGQDKYLLAKDRLKSLSRQTTP